MLKIIGKKIYLTRGDSAYINISIRMPDGKYYQLADGDEIWFAVKRKTTDKQYLIAPKTLTPYEVKDGEELQYNAYLTILPEETKNLPFGSFVYDISLVNEKRNYVTTIIEPNPFVILEEVGSTRERGGARHA